MISTTARRALKAGVAILALAAAPAAFAQDVTTTEATQVPENDDTLTIGVGGAYVPSYEGSDDYRFVPVAGFRGKVSGHNFYTRGTSVYFDLVPEKPGNNVDVSLGPVANVRFARTSRKAIKDDQVRALGKLDTAIEVGAFVGVGKTGVITSDYDVLSFRFTYLRDVTDTHDSYIIQPSIEYGTPLSTSMYVGLGVSADYAGAGFARTYFGVTPAGSLASGLDVYDTNGGWKNVTGTAFANYALSGDLRHGVSLIAAGGYTKLLGDFKDSPVVSEAGNSNTWFGALGIAYTF